MKKTILKTLLFLVLFAFSYKAKALTTIVIVNNSPCVAQLDMWDASNTYPFAHYFNNGFPVNGATSTYQCLSNPTYVEFYFPSAGNGFAVTAGGTGSGTFTGCGCLTGRTYSWTYTTLTTTCGGVPSNTLTITLN